jgi:sulfide:quinone oxidoreductase
VLILGSSFAGLNAAFALKRRLRQRAEITVMDQNPRFLFIPSLIWLVPGWRTPDEISFALEPALRRKGIQFLQCKADAIDPIAREVVCGSVRHPYDYLLIATGAHWDYEAVPGLGPRGGYTTSVGSIDEALAAQAAWQALLADPGPVVMGAAPGASCFGAEYELTFNLELALRRAGVRDRATVTFVTSEPFAGHFGMGGLGDSRALAERLFDGCGIAWLANTAIERITPGEVHLAGGRTLPFKFSLIMPPFKGADVVRASPGIGNAKGFVPVNDRYQHVDFREIYSAGVAVAVTVPEATPIPTGVPKTGYMSELMAGVAAHNIAAAITGGEPEALPFADLHALCILDAGRQGMIMATDRIFAPRQHEVLVSGPWSHWSKVLFEKYYLRRMRSGRTYLP